MRLRRASWGGKDAHNRVGLAGWRGWSLALITRKRIINLELHYERKTTNHREDS